MKMRMRTRPACPNSGQYCPSPNHNPGLDSDEGSQFDFRAAAGGGRASALGFTLVETMVATFIAAIVVPSLFAGFAAGFSMVKAAREDLRATQVILQRMEAIRLSPYKTLKDPAAYPASFTEYYSESGKTNGTGGVPYTVTYTWAPGPASLPPSYRTNVLLVTVAASWKSGNVQRSRSMQTYVARYGIQRYVCAN